MKWAKDKKKHFSTAIWSGYTMEILLTIWFLLSVHSELAYSGISDMLTLMSGVIAIYSWEYFPKWFPKVFPNRTFSQEDMYAGLMGLGLSILSFRIIFIVVLLVYTL